MSHEDNICATVSKQEISHIISKLKTQKAPGVDGVTISMLEGSLFKSPKRLLKRSLLDMAVVNILDMKRDMSSLAFMPQSKWFKLLDHVDDSEEIRTQNRVRAGDSGLGHGRPTALGKVYSYCPFCITVGVIAKLSEAHMILEWHRILYECTQSSIPAL